MLNRDRKGKIRPVCHLNPPTYTATPRENGTERDAQAVESKNCKRLRSTLSISVVLNHC